ncbi:MAG: hypothetical protein RLZZ127_60 [Planctomycetota bacterium]|jgi:cell division septum initiation protein DivIVA
MSQTNGNILRTVHRALGGKSFGELADLVDQAAGLEHQRREVEVAVTRERERLASVRSEVEAAVRQAAEAQARGAEAEQQAAQAVGRARETAAALVAEAREQATAEAARITSEAQATADRLMAEARAVVASLTEQRETLTGDVAALEAKRAEVKAFLAKLKEG